jgi:hypothetical protein
VYLKECLIENVGPIESLSLSMPFHENFPKPVVIVGKNGTGKSIFLSHVADALVEFAKLAFRDIAVANTGGRRPYLKYLGPTNQRIGSDFGIALLRFAGDEKGFTYVDKTGELEFRQYYTGNIRERFSDLGSWPPKDSHKKVTPKDKACSEEFFRNSVICYFPPSRTEFPHWLNSESVEDRERFKFSRKFSDKLGKPIFVETSSDANKAWILDVFLDSLIDFEMVDEQLQFTSNVQDKLLLKQGRVNLERLLKAILRDADITLKLNYRISQYRIAIASQDRILMPSINHLSSGQAVLFNLFATIVRYADISDINKCFQLENIEGVVLIDEIDAHLHGELQYEVLPRLIQLFPKVQFIVTTHAPLFLLGMENVFGETGFEIIEMPGGNTISTERFSEFSSSFEFYRQTRTYEKLLEETLSQDQKPLILTEGETDREYIRTALELLGRKDLLDQLDIEWVGRIEDGRVLNAGCKGLDTTRKVILANPSICQRKILLLYDCDTNKSAEDCGSLSVRVIPNNEENPRFQKGIENLLSPELAKAPELSGDRFYSVTEIPGGYGRNRTIPEFKKVEFCKWVCQERRDPEDFRSFSVIVEIIEEFLGA